MPRRGQSECGATDLISSLNKPFPKLNSSRLTSQSDQEGAAELIGVTDVSGTFDVGRAFFVFIASGGPAIAGLISA